MEQNKTSRDYSFVGNNHTNRHRIKAIDQQTGEIHVLQSLFAGTLMFGINAGLIKMCCECKNNVKSGISKDGHHITFSYTNDELTHVNKKGGRFYPLEQAQALNEEYLREAKKRYEANRKYKKALAKLRQDTAPPTEDVLRTI
jgi:hypothetical protein